MTATHSRSRGGFDALAPVGTVRRSFERLGKLLECLAEQPAIGVGGLEGIGQSPLALVGEA